MVHMQIKVALTLRKFVPRWFPYWVCSCKLAGKPWQEWKPRHVAKNDDATWLWSRIKNSIGWVESSHQMSNANGHAFRKRSAQIAVWSEPFCDLWHLVTFAVWVHVITLTKYTRTASGTSGWLGDYCRNYPHDTVAAGLTRCDSSSRLILSKLAVQCCYIYI